jgi:hypothetical protein
MLAHEGMVLVKKKMKESPAMAHDKGNARVCVSDDGRTNQIALRNSSSH